MNEQYRTIGEIINNIFENVSTDKMKNSINVNNSWKSIMESINSRTNKAIGELLASHTKIIDLKNGVLLVETDHPGYIQTLQMYNSYILNGLNKKVPELQIKSLAFRLKGNDFGLKNIEKSDKNEKKYNETEVQEKFKINNDLPEDLKNKFKDLKEEIKKRCIDQK